MNGGENELHDGDNGLKRAFRIGSGEDLQSRR